MFKDALDISHPFYIDADNVLQRIKDCKIMDRIGIIRNEPDEKKRRELKKYLPSIIFAGKFSERTDSKCISHSGLAVIDIDHIGSLADVENKKLEIITQPFVYSCFVSPSGDGLKVVVRIPADKEKHRGYYRGLMKLYPQSDTTSQNLSRVCFESCDPNIYINVAATEFTDYIDEPIPVQSKNISSSGTNYFRLGVAAKMIRDANDGEKHKYLLKASKLLGGYVATGVVDEGDAIHTLESEISKKKIDDFKAAQKTIKDGIEYGKKNPIFDTEEFKSYRVNGKTPVQSGKASISLDDNNYDFIASKEDTDIYINQIRAGTFVMGRNTGFPELDKHFRFKDQNLVMVLGHDNVGKSVVVWYLSILSAINHNWKWIIHAAENKIGGVKRKLIEFYRCKHIKALTQSELDESMTWVESHFTFIKNNDLYTYRDLLDIGKKINAKNQHNAMFIDPYNSLYFPEDKQRHEWDLRAVSEMRTFMKETNCSIYLSIHAVTNALRQKYPKEHEYAGHPMPPEKADAEGGGKFANRTDDFITIHRLLNHPTDWMITQIHVKKIKEMETGGMHTPMDAPVKLRSMIGAIGFEDMNGYNPILDTVRPTYTQMKITPNKPDEEETDLPPLDHAPF